MKKTDLDYWRRYIKAYNNNKHFYYEDKREFLRLNHLVMEQANRIHNDNMLSIGIFKK